MPALLSLTTLTAPPYHIPCLPYPTPPCMYSTLSYPTLPDPALPYHTLTYPTLYALAPTLPATISLKLVCIPVRSFPALYTTLPCRLSYPTLPCPTIPDPPTRPCPALPI